MVRLFCRILVGHNRMIGPLVICKKVIECPVPEMAGPGGMGEEINLAGLKNIRRDRAFIGGIESVQPVFFRLIITPVFMERIIRCVVERLGRAHVFKAIIGGIGTRREGIHVATRHKPTTIQVNPVQLILKLDDVLMLCIIGGKCGSMDIYRIEVIHMRNLDPRGDHAAAFIKIAGQLILIIPQFQLGPPGIADLPSRQDYIGLLQPAQAIAGNKLCFPLVAINRIFEIGMVDEPFQLINIGRFF